MRAVDVPGQLTTVPLTASSNLCLSAPGKTELLMKTALVFPGQGSQAVGMGKALAENYSVARDVFARVDSALSQNLSQLMFEGPEADLTLTANAQPALMASSIASLR